ncbi:MFS general substrate transporter [Meredithblackwellia eburnea MCA 4105]
MESVTSSKREVVHLEGSQHAPAGHEEVEFTGRQFGTSWAFDTKGRRVLNPRPSNSPDDPLNWSWAEKQYLAAISCCAVLACNITGAGPSIAIVQQAIEWFGAPPTSATISKTAYLFTTTALCNGVSLFFAVPAITKFGRRPIYITAFTIYTATLIWCACAKSFGSEIAGRAILGLAAGVGECLGALTVTDIFFTHERGLYMAWYNVLLSCGAAVGLIVDGAVTQHLPSWRYFYYVDIAFVGFLTILAFFTLPETSFRRNELILNGHVGAEFAEEHPKVDPTLTRKTYRQRLALFSGTYTSEPYWKLFIRPWGLICLPAVLLSVITFGNTIGWLVAVTSNVAPAYEQILGFSTQNTGFLFFGALIASIIGVPFGGLLGDKCSEWGAKRNGGVREPEHRLIAMVIPLITGPLSLILYGLCIQHKTNWFVGCLGISLVNFSVCCATNIALVYAIDSYKPIGDEVVTATLGYKAFIGYVLGFYTNTWVTNQGYLKGYGEMAAIEFGLLLFVVPVYVFGKKMRYASGNWPWLKWAASWSDDRDDLDTDHHIGEIEKA